MNKVFNFYGKDEVEKFLKNILKSNGFINKIYREFSQCSNEAHAMKVNEDCLFVRIDTIDDSICRLYKSNLEYIEVDDIIGLINRDKQSNELICNYETTNNIFKDNYGTYLKRIGGFSIDSKELKLMQDLMYSDINVLLKGGPGTGKTDLPQRMANELGMECLVVDCGTIKTPQDWFGTREYVEGQGTKFVPSQLVEYLQNPCMIVLDEINRTTPDCHNPIFRILDGNRKVNILPLKKVINVHPHCIIIATMNEGRNHTGTYYLDSAIRDRFEIMELELPESKKLYSLLHSMFPQISLTFIYKICDITIAINDLYKREEINMLLGLRPCINTCKLLMKGNSFIDVLEKTFINKFSDEGDIDSERTLIKQLIHGLIEKEILKSTNENIQNI